MNEDGVAVDGPESLVPLRVDGHVVYLSTGVLRAGASSDEAEVAARPASLDEALAGLAAFAGKVADSLRGADVTRLSVEFSCEFAVESGKFVAILGKASAKSGVKVGLEWEKPTT
ncbi:MULTISPECIES: CU044_2847 family protein [unclassified Micromonospora]|uniref:CU044_2847 family protein n=1 Tax=Micromonospora TaxID=1873 RepID=UPI002416A924|nr:MULTISPECIES: CU044_2847 family protein [unclassified Micromonospora]MDG4819322.1 CU044_2847 family protein [Micromonospora sp. WMMD956]WFE55782.1 CU044_2847 family protein [Micromonospora sp. WMMD712]